MSIINSSVLLGAGAAGGGLQVQRSLRFNRGDSAYLSRNFSAGDQKTWTFSCWLKKSDILLRQGIFSASGSGYFELFFDNTTQSLTVDDGSDYFYSYSEGSDSILRDSSAWYHIVLTLDAANATQADKLRMWVNNRLITRTAYAVINQNYAMNGAGQHEIGQWRGASYLNGYLANIHFIGGQSLTPSSFADTDATTGQWIPKAFTGSYSGTNSFYLEFADNSNNTAATLGKDSSTNGNHWTPTNFSVTAGSDNDSLVDTPTSYGASTDTGVGGQVRGNYCTANPLASAGTFTDGNLYVYVGPSIETSSLGTFRLPASGKWYWELEIISLGSDNYIGISDGTSRTSLGDNYYYYRTNGRTASNTGGGTYGASYSAGTILGIAVNSDAGEITFYNNGTSQGVAFTGIIASNFFPSSYRYNNASHIYNFGQRPFVYAAPSGYKCLVDTNLPTPTIAKGNAAMDILTYTGSSGTKTVTGLNFSPDLVWIKGRSNTNTYHTIADTVRGIGTNGAYKRLFGNATDPEYDDGYDVTAISSSGFTLNSSSSYANAVSQTFVGWCWDAGASTVTNTSGSLSSQVRANPAAGFSVVTYAATATYGDTVGHGLGVTPTFIILKCRDSTTYWPCYHSALGYTKYLYLNDTAAPVSNTNMWYAAPTSSTFTLGTYGSINGVGNYVAYCFTNVVGYSTAFSYTGTGHDTNLSLFKYLGFRPKLILIRKTSGTGNWVMIDTARLGYNVDNNPLYANLASAEATTDLIDILSNGFKIRSTSSDINTDTGTYIGFAWAESPFQYARAR
jgi:hypothetical protein